jgi:hypothetical protein
MSTARAILLASALLVLPCVASAQAAFTCRDCADSASAQRHNVALERAVLKFDTSLVRDPKFFLLALQYTPDSAKASLLSYLLMDVWLRGYKKGVGCGVILGLQTDSIRTQAKQWACLPPVTP